MSKKVVLLLLMLLFIPLAFASTPHFSVTNTFVDEVVNAENNLGDLVITSRPYIPDEIVFATFSTINAQQYDLLRWQGNETIRVIQDDGDVILVKNSSFYASQNGVFSFYSLQNESKLGTMQISFRDDNIIELEVLKTPPGLELSFSKQGFVLTNEEIVQTTLVVDEDVTPNDYEISYRVNNNNYTHNVEVKENLQWSVVEENVTLETNVSSGENKYLGYIVLQNDGNKDLTIKVQKSGNSSHLLVIPAPQTLFKKSTLRIEFSVQVPTSQKPTNVVVPINISGGEHYENGSFKFFVKDNIKPRIESINFSTDKAYANNEINVIATDNNQVTNVTLEYDDKKIFFSKDNQLFTQNVTFNKLSKYELTFCAFDDADNKECVVVNKSFVETQMINDYKAQISMPTKKVSQYSKTLLFNITQSTPEGVYVNLDEFVATTNVDFNDSYTIRLVDKDGGVKTFTPYVTELHVTKNGPLYIEIRSSEVADYTGIISVSLPEYAEEISNIRFDVSFKDYDVPESFIRPWSHNSELECVVDNTGDLDTTMYECVFKAPIDIRPDDISVPTTISERQELENKANVVEEKLDRVKKRDAVLISLLLVILIIGGFFSYYVIVHYPYVRISKGHDLKYKYNNKGEKEYE